MIENKLSVKELNIILHNINNKQDIPFLGSFTQIDIVFVAGLFLWYMQNPNNKRIPNCFDISQESDNKFNHSHYFKQIEELYNVKQNQIFENIPYAENLSANSFSRFFAPPIYITKRSIDYFFGTQKSNIRIETLKNKYKDNFEISDYIDKAYKNYKAYTKQFEQFEINIKQRLETSAPIFVFIFILTCKRLAKKDNRTFSQVIDYIEKIWQFSKIYTNGLHELARNIVEHSGPNLNDGQGMITIRAYSGINNNNEKIKILETHVFDYGEKGIYETLTLNTKKNKENDENNVYNQDYNTLINSNNIYTLKDFIEPTDNQKFLMQQFFREMAHYGILHFKKLIEQFDGRIIASSVRRNNVSKREQYIFPEEIVTHNEIKECDLSIGTSFYFEMPFIPSLFEKNSKITQEQSNQFVVPALSKLQSIELIEYSETDKLPKAKNKNYLININVSDIEYFKNRDEFKIDTRALETILCNAIINITNSEHNTILKNICFAINFDGIEVNKSNLLRILAKLSREKLSNFIVYNIDYNLFIELIKDNEQWFGSIKYRWNYIEDKKIDTSYWLKDKSILFLTRYKKENSNNDYFYFADLLYGEDSKTFNSINTIISNTYPNLTYINKNLKFELDDAFSIPNELQKQFFYDNSKYLLPFDALLKSKEANNDVKKELFLFNIKTILQNNLFGRKETYNNPENYVENFDGYHIGDTHFKIGNKVHSADFYYAKRLFQNSFYTTRLAMLIAKYINDKINNIDIRITLAGYEMYSELILSLIEQFLKNIYNYSDVNHFVAQNDDEKLHFVPKEVFNNYLEKFNEREIIIIVPIAATGNTSHKIENEIKLNIYKQEKYKNQKSKENEENSKIKFVFFKPSFNIILAQDPLTEFSDIKNSDQNQTSIINLNAHWYKLKDCPLCYGVCKKTLFNTDNTSLTPSLIFGNPEGKIKSNNTEGDRIFVDFNDLHFEKSTKYQSVARNDNFRIYDVDSDLFISENKRELFEWLQKLKSYLEQLEDGLKPTDNVIIIAPCHESNSQFINLINKYVFNYSATILHFQNSVDFVENFTLLNKNYLTGENSKIFYVDDSLITGKHFFELFDLIRNVTGNDSPLTASILINDQADPIIHNRAVRWSKNYFAFATYNQPPTYNINAKPLEHEHKRYKSLQESSFHDTLREHFLKKANKLNPEKNSFDKVKSSEKQIRRIKMFEATHKIYEYFTIHEEIPENIEQIVDFQLKYKHEDYYESDSKMNQKALFKVLSQYPFILYKDLRTATFDWHKKLLEELPDKYENEFQINTKDYDDDFSTFKFLLRRASFLGNYQILEKRFLKKLLLWFQRIDKYFEIDCKKEQFSSISTIDKLPHSEQSKRDILITKEENLRDFPIYVLGNYVEMIQKNGWVAIKVLENINQDQELVSQLKNSNHGRQFHFMLLLEAATVIDDFLDILNKEYFFKWLVMNSSRTNPENKTLLNISTDEIVLFLKNRPDLRKTNKWELVKEILFINKNHKIKKLKPFVNYLWIKQLLYADCIDKDQHLKFGYQTEIDAIINKMKGFFLIDKEIQAFFIVTDGQQNPYVFSVQDNSILNEFSNEFNISKNNTHTEHLRTQIIIDFLKGKTCNTGNGTETTAEFVLRNEMWVNIYNNEDVTLEFMPPEYKWLYLIRISKLNEEENGKCEFETQGLLGFYSKNNLENHILPKQLLMLLRKDISAFIKKHHKNDEFSGLIQQKEKADYQVMLRHGIDIYTSPINFYKKQLETQSDKVFIEYLLCTTNWINGRTILLSILSKIENGDYDEYNYEIITVEGFISSIRDNYKYILSFHNSNLEYFSDTDPNEVDNFIYLDENNINMQEKQIKFKLPYKLKEQIIFEIIYNIRKHALSQYYDYINNNSYKITISIGITQIFENRYMTISNNFCDKKENEHERNSSIINNKDDGLNLIHNILKKTGFGELFVKIDNQNDKPEKNKFIVNIPLKY